MGLVRSGPNSIVHSVYLASYRHLAIFYKISFSIYWVGGGSLDFLLLSASHCMPAAYPKHFILFSLSFFLFEVCESGGEEGGHSSPAFFQWHTTTHQNLVKSVFCRCLLSAREVLKLYKEAINYWHLSLRHFNGSACSNGSCYLFSVQVWGREGLGGRRSQRMFKGCAVFLALLIIRNVSCALLKKTVPGLVSKSVCALDDARGIPGWFGEVALCWGLVKRVQTSWTKLVFSILNGTRFWR